MSKNTVKNSIKIGTVLLIVAFILFRFDALKTVFSVILNMLMPFVIGAVIALFLSVPLRAIEILLRRTIFKNTDSKGLYRGVALTITLILLFLFVAFAIRSVVPDLISTIRQFGENLPQLVEQFFSWFEGISDADATLLDSILGDLNELTTGIKENIQTYVRAIFLGGVSFVSNTFSFLFTIFLALSFTLYLLFYKETFGKQIQKALHAFLDENAARVTLITGARFGSSFSSFISGLTMSSGIYGILNYVAMLIFGLPYKTSLSFLSVFLNFIPYFGPFLTGFIGFVLIGPLSLQQGLGYIILTVILQQVESNLIYPRVVGEQVGLPGIWVMVSVTIGAAMMGLFGMLMAVPVATVIYHTLGDIVEYKTLKKKEDTQSVENPLQLNEVMNRNLIITLATPKSNKDKEKIDANLKEELEKDQD